MTDRGPDGRFVKGNKASPGRSPRQLEEEYRLRFTQKLTPTKFEEISDRLIKMALQGKLEAIKLVLAYALGMPTQRNEHTGADGSPIQIIEIVKDYDTSST